MTAGAATGRADLIRFLGSRAPEAGESVEIAAKILGFVVQATDPRGEGGGESLPRRGGRRRGKPAKPPPVAGPDYVAANVPFLVITRFEAPPEAAEPDAPVAGWTADDLTPRADRSPSHPPLLPWPRLWPRLRRSIRREDERPDVDVARLADLLARGESIRRLPRIWEPKLPRRLWLILDHHPRLAPFFDDQDDVERRLGAIFGPRHVETWAFPNGPEGVPLIDGEFRSRPLPSPDAAVLLLGDLGAYGDPATRGAWLRFGRRLTSLGFDLNALLPVPIWRQPPTSARAWSSMMWDRIDGRRLTQEERVERAERLLKLLSPAIRIEPGLLRATRLSLPARDADAGTEADAWDHPKVESDSLVACSIEPDAARTWRDAHESTESRALRRRVYQLVRAWHSALSPAIEAEEVLTLREVDPDLVGADEQTRALAFLRKLRGTPSGAYSSIGSWFRRFDLRLPRSAYSDPVLGPELHRAWDRFCDPDIRSPPPPNHVPKGGSSGPEQILRLEHAASGLQVRTMDAIGDWGREPASLLAIGATCDGRVTVERRDRSARDSVASAAPVFTLSDLDEVSASPRPSWAVDHGFDPFGEWADDEIAGVRVRFRLIPPGTFLMGSPSDEPERRDNEAQHEVRLTRTYWLAEATVTQNLYEAVTGTNPSTYIGSNRPVDNVSWDDAKAFLSKARRNDSDSELCLPTEAEWEYACRAGTTTPFSFGSNIAPKQVNYNGNYSYAGSDRGEYRGRTVEVRSLPPNPWGLFEMHGNVWEWCEDWHAPYPNDPITDPKGPSDGFVRVLRGGSWVRDARGCRSARRDASYPSGRGSDFSFRLSRGQVQEVASELAAGAESEGEGRAREAKRGGLASGLGSSPSIQILTDRGRWLGDVWTKPQWATSIGRDSYGLWVEVEVRDESFRMRWIPPAPFRMGSPPTEAGRYDDELLHEVVLTRGYWLAETPCTQRVWEAVMESNPSEFKSPDRPVESVSFDDIGKFLRALRGATGSDTWRLPTEARWEYACRAGTRTSTYAGDAKIEKPFADPLIESIAWYGGNSADGFDLSNGADIGKFWKDLGDDKLRSWGLLESIPALLGRKGGTHDVAGKLANGFGLFDMLGNVWEWCADWYEPYSTDRQIDPTGPSAGTARVLRGGSWFHYARYCRSAYRSALVPGERHSLIGFRLSRGQELGQAPIRDLDRAPTREGRPNEEASPPARTDATVPKKGIVDKFFRRRKAKD